MREMLYLLFLVAAKSSEISPVICSIRLALDMKVVSKGKEEIDSFHV